MSFEDAGKPLTTTPPPAYEPFAVGESSAITPPPIPRTNLGYGPTPISEQTATLLPYYDPQSPHSVQVALADSAQPADEDLINRSLLDTIDQLDHHFTDPSASPPPSASSPGPFRNMIIQTRPDSPQGQYQVQSSMYISSQDSASKDPNDTFKSIGFNSAPYRTSTAFTNRPRQPAVSSPNQYSDNMYPTAADVFGTHQGITSGVLQYEQSTNRSLDYDTPGSAKQQIHGPSNPPGAPYTNGSALLQSHHVLPNKSQQNLSAQANHQQQQASQQAQQQQAAQQQNMLTAAAAQYLAVLQNQAQSNQPSSNGSQAQFQQAFNALQNPTINAQLANLSSLMTPQTATTIRENSQPNGSQEEISTIFVVGFPDDMQEREFQNMFTFSPGFEAATLKIPNKELTAYGPAASGAPNAMTAAALRSAGFLPPYSNGQTPSAPGIYAGATDPYNLVTVNSGGVVLDSRDLPVGAATTSASWPPNGLNDDTYTRQVLAAAAAANPTDLAHLTNLPMAPRKQIIGFAKFKSRQEALEARDVLQGRRVDVEKGAVLKAEMAKKNLHTKRGVGPLGLPLSLVGAGSLGPEALAGLANLTGLSTIVPPSTIGPNSGETLTQRERELGTLGAMGLNHRTRERERERDEEERERRRREQQKEGERNGRMRQNNGFAYDAFHSVSGTMPSRSASNVVTVNASHSSASSNNLLSPSDSNGSQSNYSYQNGNEPSIMLGAGSASIGGTIHNSSSYNSPDPFSQPVGPSPTNWPSSIGTHKSLGENSNLGSGSSHMLNLGSNSTQATPTGPPRPSSSMRSSPPDSASLVSNPSSHAADTNPHSSPTDSGGMLSINSNQPSRSMSNRSISPSEQHSQVSQPHPQSLHPTHSQQSSYPPLQFQHIQQLHQAQQQSQSQQVQFQHPHQFSLHQHSLQYHPGNLSSSSSMSGSNSSLDDLARTVSTLSVAHPSVTSPQLPSPNSGGSIPRGNAADQNPPINTLYVGNLPTSPPSTHPPNFLEDALRSLFSRCPGYRKLCFRQKSNGPMCFVEFDDVNYATKALNDLYGNNLNGFVKGGIRLSFSKNPLGVRGNSHQHSNGINGLNQFNPMGPQELLQHNLRQSSIPIDVNVGRIRPDLGIDNMHPPNTNFSATSPPPSRFFSPPPSLSSPFNTVATIKPPSSIYTRAPASSHVFNHSSNTSSFSPFGVPYGLSMNQPFLGPGDMHYDHRERLPASPNPELTRAG